MRVLALMVPLAAIGVALAAESASSPAAASGIDSCPSADPDPDDADGGGGGGGGGGGRDVSRDLMRQVDFATRAGIDPITVVVPAPDADPSRGRDLVYAGDGPLPPGGAVGLYRALLVREDAWAEWLDDGTVSPEAWDFWRAYSVQFTNEADTEEGEQDAHTWMALPAGGLDEDIDGPTWWRYGILSDAELAKAIAAINARVLVDWRRLAGGGDGGSFLLFNAHIINEPSAGEYGEKDEEENISHLAGSGCEALEGGEKVRWCGTAFQAMTSKIVYPGEPLLWCYGESYRRSYAVARTCLDDLSREEADLQ